MWWFRPLPHKSVAKYPSTGLDVFSHEVAGVVGVGFCCRANERYVDVCEKSEKFVNFSKIFLFLIKLKLKLIRSVGISP